LHDGTRNRLFISESYDATSHFESASDDVMRIYKRIFGEELDLTVLPSTEEEDADQ
jgi:Rab GDP dissociation inhibitor